MKISVIGLGKLGSSFLAVLASKGYDVIGVDINATCVEKINKGVAPIREPGLQEYISLHRPRIKATQNYEEAILSSDITFVIVPTPSDESGFFSNQYIFQALQDIGSSLTKKNSYHTVVISSTVMPGSMDKIKADLELISSRKIGVNLGLCYNPEFIALGSVIANMLSPDMILIGESDKKAGDLVENLYRSVCENVPAFCRMNFINAEVTKIAVNTFITTKISYANMLSDICERLDGGDVDIVTRAVGMDSRIGKKYIKGATAFGGPCFPRDTVAFGALAKKMGARYDLVKATNDINIYQSQRLHSLIEKYAYSKKIGILGLSYKAGTCIVENSHGVLLANQLSEKGYDVFVFDPISMEEAKKELRKEIIRTSSLRECIEAARTILIMTAWPEFSEQITPQLFMEMEEQKTIIDCWRQLSRDEYEDACELVHLGYGSNRASLLTQ